MKRLVLASLLALCAATTLLAQEYYGGGAANLATAIGNLSVAHLNSGTGANASTCWHGDGTWGACGGGAGAVTLPNGSVLSDTGNGQVTLNDSGGTFASLSFGTAGVAFPKFVMASNTFRLQRNDGNGLALAFGGTRPATCNPSDFWSGNSGPAYYCTGFGTWRPLGPSTVATSVVGGAATPAAYSGGNAVFRIVVSGTPTQLTFSLETAETGWFCDAQNITANAAHRANEHVVMLSGSTTAVVLENQLYSTGAAQALVAADEVRIHCHQF